jgi:hypothetical protein
VTWFLFRVLQHSFCNLVTVLHEIIFIPSRYHEMKHANYRADVTPTKTQCTQYRRNVVGTHGQRAKAVVHGVDCVQGVRGGGGGGGGGRHGGRR